MANLKEGEWSCYRCQFNGEHGHVTGVASLMERERSFYRGGQFNGGRMVLLEVASLMDGEWSCYRGGQFNGGGMVVIEVVSISHL